MPVKIDLTRQHPYVAEKLELAIRKAGLASEPRLPKAPKRIAPRKAKTRRRRL